MTYSTDTVEAIYMAAAREGHPPHRAVQEALGVSRATAGRLIARARNEGRLPPPRFRWQSNPKIDAVAEALGVAPDRLREAIATHADGDLRVPRLRR